jgi:fructose-1,6-bisphosphatase-3
MRISAHEPFCGRRNAIKTNSDIISDTVIFENAKRKITVRECDDGRLIRDSIAELLELLSIYSGKSFKEK